MNKWVVKERRQQKTKQITPILNTDLAKKKKKTHQINEQKVEE